jgi:hypothetical protein
MWIPSDGGVRANERTGQLVMLWKMTWSGMHLFVLLIFLLSRISLLEGWDYETVDHVLWECERFDAEKPQLWKNLKLTEWTWMNFGCTLNELEGNTNQGLLRWDRLKES